VSVDALVARVGQVLGRAQALFGGPSCDGGAALDVGCGLAGAGDRLRSTRRQMAGLTGALPVHYARFAHDCVQALDAATGTDTRLRGKVRDAGRADQSGWAGSRAVVNGAATDTAGLAPVSGTPAGQRALIAALRARLAQQQHVVDAYTARDARLAAMIRSLAYGAAGRGGSGAMPTGAMPLRGGGFGGGSPLSGWSGLAGLAGIGYGGGSRNPHATLADWSSLDRVPAEPGQGAAKAALSKLGCPYVWGAKGPGCFDCSGLTQWAWRQSGVQLGNDTYAQLTEGVAVPPGQVRAGDLIFPLDAFGEGGRSGPGHVQLAISEDQVVHAPGSGDVVRVAPMPGRYIARRPVRAPLV
jgi:cell wall-associated NlpC family hydrolase